MSSFKSMKIAITPEQPLDEVVVELKRLGYKDFYKLNPINAVEIEAFMDGTYDVYRLLMWSNASLKTLTELKEMTL